MYDELIMDHIKNARNYRVLEDVAHPAEGSNPLCGDEMRIYLKLEGDRIADIGFQCSCCGISMASASIMTELVKGSSLAGARRIVQDVIRMVEGGGSQSDEPADNERRAILDTVRRFPARTRCAGLPWQTVGRALEGVEG